MANYETLEDAQERIVELEEQLAQEQENARTLSQNNENLTADVERLRTLNQKYFNKLIAQEEQEDKEDDEDEEVLSCEDFAKTIKL